MIPTLVTYTCPQDAEAALLRILARKWSVFRNQHLVGDNRLVLRDAKRPGVIIEYFEWLSNAESKRAHTLHEVNAVWDELDAATIGGRWEGIQIATYEPIEIRLTTPERKPPYPKPNWV